LIVESAVKLSFVFFKAPQARDKPRFWKPFTIDIPQTLFPDGCWSILTLPFSLWLCRR